MAAVASAIHVAPSVKGYIVDMVESTRAHADLLLGASPRSALFLQRVGAGTGGHRRAGIRHPR